MKLLLLTPPTLGQPDPTRPFTQAVDERNGCMTSVLLQTHGDKLRLVACFSVKLDPVAAGFPPCLHAVAAAEKAVYKIRVVLRSQVTTSISEHIKYFRV